VVTRPLTVVSGSAPRVGQLAGLDTSYFLGDPAAALGIPVRDVVVHGPLGPLPAWYFPGRGSTFVIGVHGRNSTRNSQLRPSLVTLARFPRAGHVESWNIDRARYTSLLESFLSPVAP
jgi:hypothetical protein